jgi:hypothetical protein
LNCPRPTTVRRTKNCGIVTNGRPGVGVREGNCTKTIRGSTRLLNPALLSVNTVIAQTETNTEKRKKEGRPRHGKSIAIVPGEGGNVQEQLKNKKRKRTTVSSHGFEGPQSLRNEATSGKA